MTFPAKLSRLAALEARNCETLAAISTGGRAGDHPYYGYIEADIFDCPPFLMFTNNDCPRSIDILYHHRFELASMKIWCALAHTATAIIDIGAQVGVYTLAAAALRSDIPIHAFEPNPYAFTRLRINRQVNRFANVVDHAVALGHKSSVVELVWRARPEETIASGAGLGRVSGTPGTDSNVARMTRLDDALPNTLGERGLIKIDVEGAEALVFNGMPNALRDRPDIILETFDQNAVAEIRSLLQPFGYLTFAIDEEQGTLTPQPSLMTASSVGTSHNQFLTARPLDPAVASMLRT